MTSHWLSFGLALIALGQSGSSAMVQTAAVPQAPQRAQPAPRPPQSPTYLANQVDKLGAGFNGRVGIAVRSVDEGWSTSWNGNELAPQQSVSKLWVAITALDAVDQGRVRLDDRVTMTRSDLTLFHQPIAAKILGGGTTVTLGDLMYQALTKSDNTCNDKLMRSVGGPEAVRAMIRAKGLGAIRFYDGDRDRERARGLEARRAAFAGFYGPTPEDHEPDLDGQESPARRPQGRLVAQPQDRYRPGARRNAGRL